MENNYLRRCCGVTLLDHIRVDTIRDRLKVEKTLSEKIEEKQLYWYGHMRRMEERRLPKKCFEWIPHRRRKRGRPRTRWKDGIQVAMDRRELEENSWENKKKWRQGCDKRPRVL